jgi:apolipoprotein D and lipocalin family protein
MKRLVALFLFLALSGCTGTPKGIVAVDRFELDRYLGTWYEVARIDNWFERGTEQVTATYTLREDGKVKVFNRGYDPVKRKWKSAEGKAKFAGDPTVGALEVSFFGPFYGSYTVFDLDRRNYSWALVAGNSRSYFWVLSRTPRLEPALLSRLLAEAHAKGFDTLRVMRTPQAVQKPE